MLINIMWQTEWERGLGENVWLNPLAVHSKLSQHCKLDVPKYKIKSLHNKKEGKYYGEWKSELNEH